MVWPWVQSPAPNNKKEKKEPHVWWYTTVVSTFGRLQQHDCKLEAVLGLHSTFRASLDLVSKKKKKKVMLMENISKYLIHCRSYQATFRFHSVPPGGAVAA